jgi:hypothetical protein
MRQLRRFRAGVSKALKSLVRWFAAVVSAAVCGACRKAEENQRAAVLRRLRRGAPHTPYALPRRLGPRRGRRKGMPSLGYRLPRTLGTPAVGSSRRPMSFRARVDTERLGQYPRGRSRPAGMSAAIGRRDKSFCNEYGTDPLPVVWTSLPAAPRWLAAGVLHVGLPHGFSHRCTPLGRASGSVGRAHHRRAAERRSRGVHASPSGHFVHT